MQKYVNGFVFTPNYEEIMLIRKNRPFWQKGWLNGVGGHVEEGESSYDAMCRECKEESNLELYNWLYIGNITDSKTWSVECFTATARNFDSVKPLTDEAVEIIPLDNLDYEQLVQPADVFIRHAMNPNYHAIKLTTR